MTGPDKLRREANLGIPLIQALDRYGKSIDQIETVVNSLFLSPMYEVLMRRFETVSSEEIARRGPNALANDAFAEKLRKTMTPEELKFSLKMATFEADFDDPDEAQSNLRGIGSLLRPPPQDAAQRSTQDQDHEACGTGRRSTERFG